MVKRGFNLVVSVIILFIGAGITATMVDIIRNLRKERVQFKNKVAVMNEFSLNKNLPEKLRKRFEKGCFFV